VKQEEIREIKIGKVEIRKVNEKVKRLFQMGRII